MLYILYHGYMHREDGSLYEGGIFTEVKFRRLSEKRLKRRESKAKHKERQKRRILAIRPPWVGTKIKIRRSDPTEHFYWPDSDDLVNFKKKHAVTKQIGFVDEIDNKIFNSFLRKKLDLTWVEWRKQYRDEHHRNLDLHEIDCRCYDCDYERQYWEDCRNGMFDDYFREVDESECPCCGGTYASCNCGSGYDEAMEEEYLREEARYEAEELRSYHTELDDFFDPNVIDVTSLRKGEEPTVSDKLRLLNNYCQKCSSQIHPTQGCNCSQETCVYHDEDLNEVVNMGDDETDWNFDAVEE